MKRETSPCKMSKGLYEELKSQADKRGLKMVWLLDHMAIVQLEKWMKEDKAQLPQNSINNREGF